MKIVKPEVKFLTPLNGEKFLLDIQRIAKTCYKTYKTTDDIESAKRIVKSLIESGHEAMLEFADVTVNVVGNVAMYKDLRTHRHSSWAVESTRWCNYAKDKFGNEIKFLDPIELPNKNSEEYKAWEKAMKAIEYCYVKMSILGAKPDALSLLLPHSAAAEFNIKANLREWRHILSLRSSIAKTGHARPCIAQIMDQILEEFHKNIPVVFDDLWEQLQQKRAKEQFKKAQEQQLKIPFEKTKQKKK